MKERLKGLEGLSKAVFSVIMALIIGALVLIFSGINVMEAYSALFKGAFGSKIYFGDTLSRATPVMFTGLAVGFGFKAGMFNIGAEGQLLVGAVFSALIGYMFKLPAIIHLPLSILGGMVFSGLWAAVPGILKAKKGVHEVITTIMMNYIAYNLTNYFTEALRIDVIPKTPDIQSTAILPKLSTVIPFFKNSNVNFGFVIAIITAIIMYVLINKTKFGYETRAVGFSPLASEDAGMNVTKKILVVMVMSGMLAGMGGSERVLGVYHNYIEGISSSFGFEGIAVALLANNNPLGIIFSAILFGALSNGGQYMNLAADVPVDIVGIIQGLIILFAAVNKVPKLLSYIKSKKVANAKEV